MTQLQNASMRPSLSNDPRVRVKPQGSFGYEQVVSDYIQMGNTTVIPSAKERVTGNPNDFGSIREDTGLQLQVIHDHNGRPMWWYDPNTGIRTPYHQDGPPSDGMTADNFPGVEVKQAAAPPPTHGTLGGAMPGVGVGDTQPMAPNTAPMVKPTPTGTQVDLFVPGAGTIPFTFSEVILDWEISMAVLVARPAELGNVNIPSFVPTEGDNYITFTTAYKGTKFAVACTFEGAKYTMANGDIHIIFTIAAAETVS